jgi:hypothetical protein
VGPIQSSDQWLPKAPLYSEGFSVGRDFLVPVGRTVYTRGQQISHKYRPCVKIVGTRRVTWCKFHTEHPQMLGTTVKLVFSRNIAYLSGRAV